MGTFLVVKIVILWHVWNPLSACLSSLLPSLVCVCACARCCCVAVVAAAAAWTAIALRLLLTLQLAADPKLTVESVQSCSLSFSFFVES